MISGWQCGWITSRIIDHRFDLGNYLLQGVSLFIEFPAHKTAFLGAGRGLLRDFLHARQAFGNLYDSPCLFLAGGIYVGHHLPNLTGAFRDGCDRSNNAVQLCRSVA